MKNSIYREPTLYAAACTVVGVLAARGVFNSMFAFPYVFALICLLFGALSLWRTRPRSAPSGEPVGGAGTGPTHG